MKKNFLAMLVALSLVFGLAVPVMGQTGNVGGGSTVDSPVLEVDVPTNLAFAFNPLAETQVTESNFRITNGTEDAQVLVAFYLELELANGVKLATPGELIENDDNFKLTATAKELAFGIIAASAGTPGGVEDDEVAYDNENADSIVWFEEEVATSGDVEGIFLEFGFVLEAATAGDVDTWFSFYGELNAYAPWTDDDVKVSGVYLVTALSTKTEVDTVDDTLGLVEGDNLPKKPGDVDDPGDDVEKCPDCDKPEDECECEIPGVTINSGAAGTNSPFAIPSDTPIGVGNDDVIFTITLNTTLTGNISAMTFPNTTLTAGTHYTYDTATKVVSFKWVPTTEGQLQVTIGTTNFRVVLEPPQ